MARIDLGPNPGPDGRAPTPVEVTQMITTLTTELTPQWRGPWVAGGYLYRDMVTDDGWLMYANKDTADRPSPQPDGPETDIYMGADPPPTAVSSVKLMLTGNRYTLTNPVYLHSYRVYTTAGNNYDIYAVEDPEGAKVVQFVISIEATTTGWQVIGLEKQILLPGVYDMIVVQRQPEDSVDIEVASYDYLTPNNTRAPNPQGEIVHANRALESFRVSYTDFDNKPMGAFMVSMTPGDTITGMGMEWAVQAVTDNTTWVDFTVSPTVQAPFDDIADFTFSKTVVHDVEYLEDTGYWATTPYTVQGLIALDGVYENAVLNTNAYGIDIRLQEIELSADWDILSYTSLGGSTVSATRVESRASSEEVERRDHGWAQYGDSQWTETNRFIVNNERKKLTLDGLIGTIKDFMPTDLTDLWDVTTNKLIPPNVGDRYDFRLSWHSQDGNQIEQYDVQLDIGGSSGVILEQTRRVDKGNSAVTRDWISGPLYSMPIFVQNGGEFWVDTTYTGGKVEFWDFRLVIGRSFRA